MNKDTKDLYEELFYLVNKTIKDKYKPFVKAEVIMLTHNEGMHLHNLKENPEAEKILWQPDRQEKKTSQYGSKNLRYNRFEKVKYVRRFTKLHDSIIPWNTIRYIF